MLKCTFLLCVSNLIFLSRGVGMALKIPSRSLKKDCAAILESLKV